MGNMSDHISELMQKKVQHVLRHGYVSTDSPLAVDEYVRERKHCPHNECTWELDTEWWTAAGPSRYLGHKRIDQECQAHLETHPPPI